MNTSCLLTESIAEQHP